MRCYGKLCPILLSPPHSRPRRAHLLPWPTTVSRQAEAAACVASSLPGVCTAEGYGRRLTTDSARAASAGV